jgi:hypothetical protein
VAYAPFITTAVARDSWQDYAANNRAWVEESLDIYAGSGIPVNFTSFIYRRDSYGHEWQSNGEGPWLPMWQISPPAGIKEHINFDLLSLKDMDGLFDFMQSANGPVLSRIMDTRTLCLESIDGTTAAVDSAEPLPQRPPKSVVMYPVHSTLQKQKSKIVGVLIGILPWDQHLKNVVSTYNHKTVLVTITDVDGKLCFYQLKGILRHQSLCLLLTIRRTTPQSHRHLRSTPQRPMSRRSIPGDRLSSLLPLRSVSF